MSNRGVFGKYILEKADGTRVDPEATYFVLRLDTDEAARLAMREYARQRPSTQLARDIIKCVDALESDWGLGSGIWFHGGNGGSDR